MGYIICCGHAKTYIDVLKTDRDHIPDSVICPHCNREVTKLKQKRKIRNGNYVCPQHFFISERSYTLLEKLEQEYNFTLPQKECAES